MCLTEHEITQELSAVNTKKGYNTHWLDVKLTPPPRAVDVLIEKTNIRRIPL